jgi:2-methylcitrate dehydratase PrpD
MIGAAGNGEEQIVSVARDLAGKILTVTNRDIPDAAKKWARTAILDTIGVALAGSVEESVRILNDLADMGPGRCLILGGARRTHCLDAVLINATAAHALDFDDVNLTMGGHPSVPLVPAILALGEIEGASGGDAITAYVTGFETMARIGRAVHFHHYEKGWHPTATIGIFGTVAAAARILKLDEARTATALGLAVSLAAGVKANFGTMTKPLQVGMSARNGVMAALLARDGFTANPDAFEHDHGFFNVFNGPGTFDVARIMAEWADPFDIVATGVELKQFPCCGSTHSAIYCMLDLAREHGLRAAEVTGIEVLTNPRRLPHTNNPEPQTGLEAKFSLPYVVARALTDGGVAFAHFEDDAWFEPPIRRLLRLIRTGEHPEMGRETENQFGAEVTVTTGDGRFSARIDHQIGRGPANPMSRDELRAKFEDCAGRALPAGRIGPAFEMLENLEKMASLRELTDALAPGPRVRAAG